MTPTPAKPLPPVKAPELPDMSGFAPSNQYVPKPPAPTIDDAEPIPERVCSECGYSLEGLETTLCPECGHENKPVRKPKSQILEEESRRIARLEYVKPAVTLAAGVLIVVAILLLGRPWLTAVGWVGGLPVRVIIGTLAYFLCCLWFFGFDAPWRLTALRLAATYAISDIPIAIIRSIGFNAAMPLAYVIAMAICVVMFIWLFELDPSDAWLLVMVSTVVNGVVGFLLAVAISMVV